MNKTMKTRANTNFFHNKNLIFIQINIKNKKSNNHN